MEGLVYNRSGLVWLSLEPSYVLTFSIGIGIICAIGNVLNIGTLCILHLKLKPLSPQNMLVSGLFFTNTVFCIYLLPVFIIELCVPEQTFPDVICSINGGMLYLFVSYFTCFLLLISLNRYFMVVHPHSDLLYFGNRKRTGYIIAAALSLVSFANLPALTGVWGEYGYVRPWDMCTAIPVVLGGNAAAHTFREVAGIGIPLVIIIYCYIRIVIAICKQNLKLNKTITPKVNVVSHGQNNVIIENKLLKRKQRQLITVTLTSMAIAFLFIVCNFPIVVVSYIDDYSHIMWFVAFADTAFHLHLIFDPLVYAFGDKDIRKFTYILIERYKRGTNARLGTARIFVTQATNGTN